VPGPRRRPHHRGEPKETDFPGPEVDMPKAGSGRARRARIPDASSKKDPVIKAESAPAHWACALRAEDWGMDRGQRSSCFDVTARGRLENSGPTNRSPGSPRGNPRPRGNHGKLPVFLEPALPPAGSHRILSQASIPAGLTAPAQFCLSRNPTGQTKLWPRLTLKSLSVG